MASVPQDRQAAARIVDLLAAGPTLSFEFFPPRNDEAERQLEKTIHELAPLRPSFVSVTYGAGGSTRDRTRDIVMQVNREQVFPAMAHLTCVGHSRDQIVALLDEYEAGGVHNILALAGLRLGREELEREQPLPGGEHLADRLVGHERRA